MGFILHHHVVSFQGSLAFHSSYFVCGDIHEKAVNRTQSNLDHIECHTQRRYMDVLHWDTTHLILRDSSVDICVTDLVSGRNISVVMFMVMELSSQYACTECCIFYLTLNVYFTFSGMCKIYPFAFDDALEPKCVGVYISDKCIVLVVNKSLHLILMGIRHTYCQLVRYGVQACSRHFSAQSKNKFGGCTCLVYLCICAQMAYIMHVSVLVCI